ncbi:MAG: hypothetical protein M3O55_01870 [Actinomycetota bacterium]|nr:hypothetical protein [Actinomycetota bacterium]
MSVPQKFALGLVAAGMLGLGSMLVYLQACRWADWRFIPARRRSSVIAWHRRAPLLIVLSACIAGVGFVLGVTVVVVAD